MIEGNSIIRNIRHTVAILAVAVSATVSADANDGVIEGDVRAMVDGINDTLHSMAADYHIGQVDYYVEAGADEGGQTLYFGDVGNKQLDSHWIRGDIRRGGFSDIAYIVDQVDGAAGLDIADTTAAIDRAMASWDDVQCSDIPIFQLSPAPGLDLGFVQYLSTGGAEGLPFPIFDITHGGWMPLTPGVLGITFTFVFTGTDDDANGKQDTAFREIYYASGVPWGIDTPGFPFDVETIALHEAGHGLSQAHFGKLFETNSNERFHFAPRALMNSGYTGVQQEVGATDLAGHCSMWGSW
jgi:hypothetical protein